MKTFYLFAALVGTIIPMVFFTQFLNSGVGGGFAGFIPALFVNGAAGGFTADLLISSFVFWAFIIAGF